MMSEPFLDTRLWELAHNHVPRKNEIENQFFTLTLFSHTTLFYAPHGCSSSKHVPLEYISRFSFFAKEFVIPSGRAVILDVHEAPAPPLVATGCATDAD